MNFVPPPIVHKTGVVITKSNPTRKFFVLADALYWWRYVLCASIYMRSKTEQKLYIGELSVEINDVNERGDKSTKNNCQPTTIINTISARATNDNIHQQMIQLITLCRTRASHVLLD